MPLLDHSLPHLQQRCPWESFHSSWCTLILLHLKPLLPAPRFSGIANVHLGPQVAADVAEFDVGVSDDLEVRIMDTRGGMRLLAVIELVSPSNKERPVARDHFAAKCAAYLQRGIGVVVIDLIGERRFNLHNQLMELLHQPQSSRMTDETPFYATGYRPVQRNEQNQMDVWLYPLAIGQELPTVPLALRGIGCVPLELEASYGATRELIGI